MLNSAEHEIFPAHKCQNANNYCHFKLSEREKKHFRIILAGKELIFLIYFYTNEYSNFHAQLTKYYLGAIDLYVHWS